MQLHFGHVDVRYDVPIPLRVFCVSRFYTFCPFEYGLFFRFLGNGQSEVCTFLYLNNSECCVATSLYKDQSETVQVIF